MEQLLDISQAMIALSLFCWILLFFIVALSIKKNRTLIDLVKAGSLIYRDLDAYIKPERVRLVKFATYTAASIWCMSVLFLVVRAILFR